MPSTPTTKSQVQAYRFVLRRMQSALVRKDAVMLHDPMRTHTRATVVGVCIAAVGVVGFLVWGLLSPSPKPPDKNAILISKQSGQVYVLIENPRQLIPTFNLASARLLLAAKSQPQNQGQQQGQAAQPDGGGQGPVTPTVVDEKELKDIPRGRKTGIENAPDLLPGEDQRIDPLWAVCDAYKVERTLPNPTSENRVETTVLGGVKDLGPELPDGQALLVHAPNNVIYLIYRTPTTANIKNANAVRAAVGTYDRKDPNNPNENDPKQVRIAPAVAAALNLDVNDVRLITTGLLNAITEEKALQPEPIEGHDTAPSGFSVEGLKIGEVFQVERTGQAEPEFYVVQREGIEPIKRTTADLIRFAENVNSPRIKDVKLSSLTNVPDQDVDRIDDIASPNVQPQVLNAEKNPVACLGWNLTGEGTGREHHTAVHVGEVVPLPRKADGSRYASIDISTPGADGQRIDHFFMAPGRAAVVRGSRSKEDLDAGPISLISDRGVKYGVPDQGTASILGLSNQRPAYYSIINLLPDGASLNTREVLQTYDSVPVGAGTFETPGQQPGSGGG